MVIWNTYIKSFKEYMLLERSMSVHSIDAYIHDIRKLESYMSEIEDQTGPDSVKFSHLEGFVNWINKIGLGAASQARILSGIRAFYKFLLIEDIIEDDPTELLEGPKLSRKIPDILSYDEICLIMDAMDMSLPHAQRNRAMLETLYACGLRVSELVGLRISNYFPKPGFVKVLGKNNKERITPIGSAAIKHINLYVEGSRNSMMNIQKGHEDFIFLNRRGRQLTRVMIFKIVKDAVAHAGIKKTISPHTFRHSFATHLVEGGADLRAVQEMLGHESITTTEIYTHIDTSYLRETIINCHPANKR